ncbi:MAG: TetR/AcrR family transcriptional regulator [Actinomycetia bacterium]|nr:TetR/AcrR family transcriptional regulator [Actinomycetes bacterium]
MTAGTKGQQPVTSPERRRSIRSHQAILAATAELLAGVGYTALTIEGVAARAGVGKATVYRWWPSKGALVIEAMSAALAMPSFSETGDLRQDLLTVGNGIVETLARSPAGAVISALAADLMRNPDMAEQFRDQVIRPRRSAVTQILRRAADRGELPPDVDIDLLLDVYAGAVFYRVLVSGEPVTDLLAEQLVSLLLDGKAPVKPA